MKIKHGIVAISRKQIEDFANIEHMTDKRFMEEVNKLNILGFTGYETEPDGVCYMSLYHEYRNDPTHDLRDTDIVLIPASDEVMENLRKDIPELFEEL